MIMKIYLLVLAIVLLCLKNVYSQDLIVTTIGDSINCKIIKIKKDYIYFYYKYGDDIKNSLIPSNNIKFYKKDFYTKSNIPPNIIGQLKKKYKRFDIGVNGGYSYMIGKVDKNLSSFLQTYEKKLKNGYHFGAEMNYFTSEYFGIGLYYSIFRAKNQLDNVYTIDSVTKQVRTGILKDDITIQFFGPSVCRRFTSKNNADHFLLEFSLGYMGYKDKATVIDNFTLASETLGMRLVAGFDVKIDNDWDAGISFELITGSLDHYRYDDGIHSKTITLDNNHLASISRIDLSLWLKWCK